MSNERGCNVTHDDDGFHLVKLDGKKFPLNIRRSPTYIGLADKQLFGASTHIINRIRSNAINSEIHEELIQVLETIDHARKQLCNLMTKHGE